MSAVRHSASLPRATAPDDRKPKSQPFTTVSAHPGGHSHPLQLNPCSGHQPHLPLAYAASPLGHPCRSTAPTWPITYAAWCRRDAVGPTYVDRATFATNGLTISARVACERAHALVPLAARGNPTSSCVRRLNSRRHRRGATEPAGCPVGIPRAALWERCDPVRLSSAV